MGALIALAARVGAALGRGPVGRALPALGAGIGGVGIGTSVFGDDDMKKRRRRRKALTQTDMNTALVIASSISKKAAENFILMRVRAS